MIQTKISPRRIVALGLVLLTVNCAIPSVFAQGALTGSHTTANCLADENCTKTVLNRVKTLMGELNYQAGFPTPDTEERI